MSSTKLHIAIPDSAAMACDPRINLDSLRVGFILGSYSKLTSSSELEKTQFGTTRTLTEIRNRIRWGKKDLPYDKTVTLGEIYEAEGNFTIEKLIVQWVYPEKIVYNGVPKEITTIFLHKFRKWNFAPSAMEAIFDRIPSHPLLELLKKEKKKWLKKTGDYEAYKRMKTTWLLNRPEKALPYNIYNLWYGKGAMIIPESLSDFTGKELGINQEA